MRDSSSSCKAYVYATIEKILRIKGDLEINFKKEEIENLDLNLDDASIVSIKIINSLVNRIMINTCSSTDILYFDAFQKLGFSTNNYNPMFSSFMGFMSDFISPLGTMNLHVIFGDEHCSKMMLARFMIIDIYLAYNAIIGRSMPNRLRAMVSAYHMVLKF